MYAFLIKSDQKIKTIYLIYIKYYVQARYFYWDLYTSAINTLIKREQSAHERKVKRQSCFENVVSETKLKIF